MDNVVKSFRVQEFQVSSWTLDQIYLVSDFTPIVYGSLASCPHGALAESGTNFTCHVDVYSSHTPPSWWCSMFHLFILQERVGCDSPDEALGAIRQRKDNFISVLTIIVYYTRFCLLYVARVMG